MSNVDTIAASIVIDADVASLGQSQTLMAQRIVRARRAAGKPVYNWGLGASPFDAPPMAVASLCANAGKKNYESAEGIAELSKALRERYALPGYVIPEGNTLVAPGLKHLLLDAQQCFGGGIVHVSPYWVSYGEQTRLLGKQKEVISVVCKVEDEYKLTADALDAACGGPEVGSITLARVLTIIACFCYQALILVAPSLPYFTSTGEVAAAAVQSPFESTRCGVHAR
jgi:hypothetical protein